jgi:uncharacterized cupredoxin-like copper-binding protein
MRFVQAIVLVALGAVSCSKTERAAEQAPPAPPPPPPTVHVVATEYAFQAPDTLPAGLTSFHLMNNGKLMHHLVLMRLAEGQTIAALQKMKPGAIPAGVVMVGGPNPALPSSTAEATVNLQPGNYAMFCVIPGPDGKPHLMNGMVRSLTVTPSQAVAAEPVADITVKLADYSFDMSAPFTAGHHVVRVEDAGPQPHEFVLVKLEPGKTVEQFVQWTEKMQGPPPGLLLGGVSLLTVGEANFITLDLTPGEYGLICFVSDGQDFKPHFMHGMIKQVTVQ